MKGAGVSLVEANVTAFFQVESSLITHRLAVSSCMQSPCVLPWACTLRAMLEREPVFLQREAMYSVSRDIVYVRGCLCFHCMSTVS